MEKMPLGMVAIDRVARNQFMLVFGDGTHILLTTADLAHAFPHRLPNPPAEEDDI
jgi:hypothetical protein